MVTLIQKTSYILLLLLFFFFTSRCKVLNSVLYLYWSIFKFGASAKDPNAVSTAVHSTVFFVQSFNAHTKPVLHYII